MTIFKFYDILYKLTKGWSLVWMIPRASVLSPLHPFLFPFQGAWWNTTIPLFTLLHPWWYSPTKPSVIKPLSISTEVFFIFVARVYVQYVAVPTVITKVWTSCKSVYNINYLPYSTKYWLFNPTCQCVFPSTIKILNYVNNQWNLLKFFSLNPDVIL